VGARRRRVLARPSELDDDADCHRGIDYGGADDAASDEDDYEGEEVGGGRLLPADDDDYPYDERDGLDEYEDEEEELLDEVLYDGDDMGYEDDEDFAEEVPEHMSASWAREVELEEAEDDEGYRDMYDDGDEDDEDRLSPQDVEQLVERYLITRKRADELEGENAKLTQQLLELAHGQAPETLVVQVSPEMW